MRALLPFFDDSTLFFANAMATSLRQRGVDCTVAIDTHTVDFAGVSERQLQVVLGAGKVATAPEMKPDLLAGYDAVFACRTTREMRDLFGSKYRDRAKRPCFITFQPGLEFTPERGFRNRCMFDALFLFNREQAELYKRSKYIRAHQYVSWGHPYSLAPKSEAPVDEGAIVFFAQAVSPKTLAGRQHISDVLVTLAEAYPNREVRLKLRHLPNENGGHVHREVHPYPDLLPTDPPPNLKLVAGTMAEALSGASIAITCTSTAAMEAVSAGVATGVYTRYLDHMADPLSARMATAFEGSGLLIDLPDLLELKVRHASRRWVHQNFRSDEMFDEIIAVVERFRL